jgi:hypothetical protein
MSATDQQLRTLLAYLGTAMIATGQTVGEVEDELAEVSARLAVPMCRAPAHRRGSPSTWPQLVTTGDVRVR